MGNNMGLGKAYRIIRNINCGICCFCVFMCGVNFLRMIKVLAANQYSLFGLPFFLIALLGMYKLEQRKRIGIVMLPIYNIGDGICRSGHICIN